MKALVTGATGFTGSHLTSALLARGYAVRALVRDAQRAQPLIERGTELVVGDLTSRADVVRAVRGCDIVFHVAALYREARHPDRVYWEVNVEGTRNVLYAAERAGVRRVVHCSTVGVHGDVDVPADEGAPYAPGDIYQETKLAAEQVARDYFEHGLCGVIVRPAGIYGPGDHRFLKLFRAVKNGTFRMIGRGDTLYHMSYVDDIVAGMIVCGEHPAAAGGVFILAGPRYTSLRELVSATARAVGRRPPRGHVPLRPVMMAARVTESLCRGLGVEPPLHRRRVEFFVKNRGFCIDKARRELGFEPRVDLAEGLQRTARWYEAHGLL